MLTLSGVYSLTKIMQNGWTPLHIASKLGYVDAVQALTASGAKVDATENVMHNHKLCMRYITDPRSSIYSSMACHTSQWLNC